MRVPAAIVTTASVASNATRRRWVPGSSASVPRSSSDQYASSATTKSSAASSGARVSIPSISNPSAATYGAASTQIAAGITIGCFSTSPPASSAAGDERRQQRRTDEVAVLGDRGQPQPRSGSAAHGGRAGR